MRQNIDAYYLDMLKLVAARSTCGRRAVGAIIVDVDHHILSTGYNGVPKGFIHCTDHPCPGRGDKSGDSSRCEAVHAEVNAILQCSDIMRATKIYVSCTPCFSCAKMIANTHIAKVIVQLPYPDIGDKVLEQARIRVITAADLAAGIR